MNNVTFDQNPSSPDSTPALLTRDSAEPIPDNGGDPEQVPATDAASQTTTSADDAPAAEPPRPTRTEDLVVQLAFWLRTLGIGRESAFAAALAAIGVGIDEHTLDRVATVAALRAARAVLGPLPLEVQQAVRHHVAVRLRIRRRRAADGAVVDQYSPSTRPARFRRLHFQRVLTRNGERHEIHKVRAVCPVCREETAQIVELNLPHSISISCEWCVPAIQRGRRRGYCPPPFLLRTMYGEQGLMPANIDGAIRVLLSITSGSPV